MRIQGQLLDIITATDLELYGKSVVFKNGKKTLYV